MPRLCSTQEVAITSDSYSLVVIWTLRRLSFQNLFGRNKKDNLICQIMYDSDTCSILLRAKRQKMSTNSTITRKPCWRRETARCRCKFWSISTASWAKAEWMRNWKYHLTFSGAGTAHNLYCYVQWTFKPFRVSQGHTFRGHWKGDKGLNISI